MLVDNIYSRDTKTKVGGKLNKSSRVCATCFQKVRVRERVETQNINNNPEEVEKNHTHIPNDTRYHARELTLFLRSQGKISESTKSTSTNCTPI